MNKAYARYTKVLIAAIFFAVLCFAVVLGVTPKVDAETVNYGGTYTYGVTYENLEVNLKENGEQGGYYELNERYYAEGKDKLVEGGKIGRFEFDAVFKSSSGSESRDVKIYIIVQKRTPILTKEIDPNKEYSEHDIFVDSPSDLSATYGDLQSTLSGGLPENYAITEGGNTVGNAGKRYIPIMYTPADTEHYKILSGTYFSNTTDYAYNPNCTVGVDVARAEYDMSGVKFNDATVYFTMGDLVNIGISGTLPDGVSVTYEGNSVSSEGEFTVTAKFSGDIQNYMPIPNMTAKLTTVMTAFSKAKGSLNVKIYSTIDNASISSLVNVNIALTEENVSANFKRYIVKINSVGEPNGEYYIDMNIIGFRITGTDFSFYKNVNNERVNVTDYQIISDSVIRVKDTSFGEYILEIGVEPIDIIETPTKLWWIIPLVLCVVVLIAGGVALFIIYHKKRTAIQKDNPTTLDDDNSNAVIQSETTSNNQIEKKLEVDGKVDNNAENKQTKQTTNNSPKSKKKKKKSSSKQQYLGKKKN